MRAQRLAHRNEVPVYSVDVARFEIGKYEVTVGQFRYFVAATKYVTDAEKNADGIAGCWIYDESWKQAASKNWRDPSFPQTENDPVVCISWNDAKAYIAWLNEKTGENYRLPTEAEWEYAARAGTTMLYSWGNDIGINNANCGGSCGDSFSNTAPVGSFPSNAFGLYDMHGNVWEWVEDCWHDSYMGAPSDGSAWVKGCTSSERVLRGGSWSSIPVYLRSVYRISAIGNTRRSGYGFRIARTL